MAGNRDEASFWKDENVLKVDFSDIRFCEYVKPLNCTL